MANKSKEPKIYEFDPVIYPRKLWVCIGLDEDYLNVKFHGENNAKLNFESNSSYYAITFDDVVRNDTNMIGELIVYQSKNDMRMGTISHEASHVVDGIENAISMKHGDEPSAYLLEWVCKSINLARLGECEPVRFKENGKKK